jgi:hypothetical protein
VKKRDVNQLLRETAVELAEGEELLAEKKKARKKAKSKLARKNAERSVDLINKAVESIEHHLTLLKRDDAPDPPDEQRLD